MAQPQRRYDLFLLPGWLLLLFGLTYGLVGFYYETNDDQIITFLLRGLTIQPALADLKLYFLGFSRLLTWLYAAWPQVPWYGLLLYGWLLAATWLACWLLWRAYAGWPPGPRWGLLTAFYIFCWLEHVMWFNYLRVPLLLAGTSFLFLLWAPATYRWQLWSLGGLLFTAALCIRPSAAGLALLVVGPAALFLGAGFARPRRTGAALALLLALSLAFALYRHQRQTPATQAYQALDLWKSAILDYDIYQPRLRSRADTLAHAAIGYWLLADRQVLSAGFYRQHGQLSLAYLVTQAGPPKMRALLAALGRDQFLLLGVNALLVGWIWRARPGWRGRLLGYQVYFWLLLLAIGLVLKLPPRVLTPCLSLYTLVHLLAASGLGRPAPPRNWRLAGVIAGLLALAYLVKVGHRAQVQQRTRQVHEQFMAEVARAAQGHTLVYSALPYYFRSLSPLRNYYLGARVLVPLTGWSTLDPAYAGYYRRQTGQAALVPAIMALSRQKSTLWVLEPGFYPFLKAYVRAFYGAGLHLQPQASPLERYGVKIYRGLENSEKRP